MEPVFGDRGGLEFLGVVAGAFSEDHCRNTKKRTSKSGTFMSTQVGDKAAARFLLWVDGVGGYLVCPQEEIRIGQALPDSEVEIPLRCELARHQITLRRTPEGFIASPALEEGGLLVSTSISGKPLVGPSLLVDGDTIELGSQVKLRFRKPHALSNSARLEFLTPHRTLPYADAVLLLAESCVLGPKGQSHVVCPEWNEEVILVRQQNQLFCKSAKPVKIDGVQQEGRAALGESSQVSGADFSFALEPVVRATAV